MELVVASAARRRYLTVQCSGTPYASVFLTVLNVCDEYSFTCEIYPMKNAKLRFMLLTAMLLVFLPASSFAESECTTDADCGEGYVCETYSEPCVDVACPPDSECPDVSCDPAEYGTCEPAPPPSCTTSADCSADEVCVSFTYETCSGSASACAPDEQCTSHDVDESCSTETESYCLPPYLAPCQIDSDCGEGFSCVEAQMCECSGGDAPSRGTDSDGSSESADSANADAGVDNCTCSGTGQFYCELNEQACAGDADCAGDLICDTLPWDDSTDRGAVDGGSTCAQYPDGGTSCEDTSADAGESVEPDTYCQPADLGRWAGAAEEIYEDTARGDASEGSSDEDGDRQLVSAEADRSSSTSTNSNSDGAACSATGAAGAPVDAALAAVFFGLLGMVGLRRRD